MCVCVCNLIILNEKMKTWMRTIMWEHCQNNSLPRRVRAVIRGRGYPTKYWLTKYFRKKDNIWICLTLPETFPSFAKFNRSYIDLWPDWDLHPRSKRTGDTVILLRANFQMQEVWRDFSSFIWHLGFGTIVTLQVSALWSRLYWDRHMKLTRVPVNCDKCEIIIPVNCKKCEILIMTSF